MPQFPYLVSDLLYDIVETVNCKFSRILTDSRILTATSRVDSIQVILGEVKPPVG